MKAVSDSLRRENALRSPKRLRTGLVAFVDILGFSDRVEGLRRSSDEDGLRSLERDIEFVQDVFGHRPKEVYIRESQKLAGKKVLAFSDCVVVSTPLFSRSTKVSGKFDVLGAELHTLALAQARCISESIFLRGGIDIGLWYRNVDTLISPALVRAYKLEKEASVPVIAITEKLLEFFNGHPDRNYYAKDSNPLNKVLSSDPAIPGKSDYKYLDYLPLWFEAADAVIARSDAEKYKQATPEIREQMRTEAWENTCREIATLHMEKILKARSAAKRSDVREKYDWLASYHNDRVRKFFGPECHRFLISGI